MKEERFATLPSVLAEYGQVSNEDQRKSSSNQQDQENLPTNDGQQKKKKSAKDKGRRRKSPQHQPGSREGIIAQRSWGRKGSEEEAVLIFVETVLLVLQLF
ncbi:hypothetical protein PoB_002842500 [Plakobranchus ocellatus]|uniref:Uncharacterized protein n=1 Tax=Plakobranchus ocellatus TaxID=259542 RepID=A0AAV4A4X3_9GAST|nr:hypothetical protein PoB_002842500 [Plakobranchus ocellatus]